MSGHSEPVLTIETPGPRERSSEEVAWPIMPVEMKNTIAISLFELRSVVLKLQYELWAMSTMQMLDDWMILESVTVCNVVCV
jgi:hypothetical protein